MRGALAIGLVALSACVRPPTRPSSRPLADERAAAGSRPNVDGARELDQAGVRAFREGRFTDAARFFRAALDLGGPSSELWNIARSRERMDDPEGASGALDEYLGRHDLSAQERAQAEHEVRALRGRPSVLIVTTTPSGAVATLDSKETLGPTPLSIEIAPGIHSVTLRHGRRPTETRTFEASYGRAVIVSLDLGPERK
ncbi:MAG TPA: PEGA domain-containing protein [Polyangiaceae bacterium]|nr:PEGA domain-containing protein [Polyangiaceae bacterium]